jgi:hypothetical protein
MVSETRSAPLVAFLSSLSSASLAKQLTGTTDVKESDEPREAVAERRVLDEDTGEGARAVILTILSNKSPISDSALRSRSEIDPDLYDDTLQYLKDQGLIAVDPKGLVLTPAGVTAAARERDRLLSLW